MIILFLTDHCCYANQRIEPRKVHKANAELHQVCTISDHQWIWIHWIFLSITVIALQVCAFLCQCKILRNLCVSSITWCVSNYIFIQFWIRNLLGHLNYPSLSFLPGFFSAILAIFIERPARRSLLAVYVANVVGCVTIVNID